ncbi:TOBE domain-containing protein [Methanocaldococcus fervens]|uniref:TOBE domain-containing protein n=1 Tax=Methanocaldococcus fervens TaxID=83171 RepID=UPI00315CCFD4
MQCLRCENKRKFKKIGKKGSKNEIKCKVKEIKKIGNIINLILEINGVKLICILTPNALYSLDIKEGDEVYAIIKATNVRIIG